MGPIPQPASSQYSPPQPDTNPNIRKDTAAEKRKRAGPLRGLGLVQPPSLAEQPHAHLQLFPKLQLMSHSKQMLQKIDPRPWKMLQFVKALHGPVMERCWETSSRTEIGCSLPTT